ncbi:exoenzymes regulatory protein AepA precursor [alpha proteobacterium U9-1i]|nr:exoenzymes regulatory protein AepA precursor [alpha proteobacterium U9-1i]
MMALGECIERPTRRGRRGGKGAGAWLIVLMLSAALISLGACHPVADVVIRNADIRTMDSAMPVAQALALRGDRIAFVGGEDAVGPWIGPATRIIDAGGHTVLPGLIDTHIHLAEGAMALGGCSLDDAVLSIAQASVAIRGCAAAKPDDAWIVVNGVNAAGFRASRTDLDAIEPARALMLYASDGHTAWLNSRALDRAQITRSTSDPTDGRIERDARGEPTGLLVDGATALAFAAMPTPTTEQRLEALRRALPLLHAVGVTSYLEANTPEPIVAAYAELARRGELSARVSVALASSGENTPAEFERLSALRAQLSDPLFRADFIKLFADGVLEHPTQTAALLEPYRDARGRPGPSRGRLYLAPQDFAAFVTQADRHDFNVHVHAIGDAAVHETLDAFAAARAAGDGQLLSISHLQLIAPEDLPRFAQLDVSASLQLLWAQPDNYSVEALTPWLGAERLARIYPARSLADAGARIAGGSDWDVSSFNPFEAMATAMSRRNIEEPARPPLNANESLSLDQMLAAYTINAAQLIGRDEEVGSLTLGKYADVIVLDRRFDTATTADAVRGVIPEHVFFSGRELPL